MKKLTIIVLIGLGVGLGLWLARQNQKLFELPVPQKKLQYGNTAEQSVSKRVEIGMDMWQVKEILGPPLKRIVVSKASDPTGEIWTYTRKKVHFENGIVTRMETF